MSMSMRGARRADMIRMFSKDIEGDFRLEPFYNGSLFKQGTELIALQRDNLELGNIAPQDISKLDDLLKEQARAVKEKNADLFESTDEDFHSYISEINPEPKLVHFLRILRDQMQLAVTVAITNPEHLVRAHLEHRAILKALSERDQAAAELAMRAHIAGSKERVAETLRKSPEDTPSTRQLSKLELKKPTLEVAARKRQVRIK